MSEENLVAADREGVASRSLVQNEGDWVRHGFGEAAADAAGSIRVLTVNSW